MADIYDKLLDQAPSQNPRPEGVDIYDQLLNRREEDEKKLLVTSLQAASQFDPNKAAEAQRLGAQVGVPSDIAERNLDEIRARVRQQAIENQRLMATSPVLARQLQDLEFAKIAQDQIDNLSKTEKTFKWFTDIPKDISKGWEAGRLQSEQGFLGEKLMRGAASPEDIQRIGGIDTRLRELKGTGGFAEATTKILGQMSYTLPESIAYGQAGAVTAGSAAFIAGQLGPQAAVPEEIFTVPAAAIGGFFAGSTAKMAEQSYRVEAGQAYLDMIKDGIDQNVARNVAAGVGLVNGTLEVVGISFVTAPIKAALIKEVTQELSQALTKPTTAMAVKEFAKNYGKAWAGEVTTELLQEVSAIAGDEIARSISKPELESKLSTEEGRKELAQRMIDVFEEVGKGMAVLALPGASFNFHSDYKRAQEAKRQSQFFADLTQSATESEVRKRNPTAYENFIQAQAANTGAENVYVDAQQFVNVLRQANISTEQLAQTLPEVAGQVQEALQTGGDVVIPTQQYAARIAGTEFGDALMQHARIDPDAMSAAEAVAFEQNKKQIMAQAGAIIEQQAAVNEGFAASAKEVETKMYDQLMATGQYQPKVARTNAEFVRDFVVTQAAAMKMLPSEFYDRYMYKVEMAGQQQAAGEMLNQETRPSFYRSLLPNAGYSRIIDPDSPRIYKNKSGEAFATFEKDGARIAFSSNNILYEDDRGRVAVGYGEENESIVRALIVDPDKRKQGRATAVMQDLVDFADKSNTVLYLEPAAIDTNNWVKMSTEQLADFYKRFGFVQVKEGSDKVLVRKPQESVILKQALDEDKAWRNWEPEVTSTGKIKGAPEWVSDKNDLARMRRELRKYVREGLVGRFWYENSAQAVMDLVQGDVALAEKFIQLLAIYSPNSNVWVNTLQAVRAFTHWRLGRPAEQLDVGTADMDGKAVDVLYNNVEWDGRKTNSFYLNLMHDIVEKYPAEMAKLNIDPELISSINKAATIDVWMARAFGYEVEAFADDKGTGKYSFSENEVRRLSARLNAELPPGEPRWTPHQVQAAIWTAMKTRYEFADVKEKTNAKSLREGLIYRDAEGKMVYPKTAEERRKHLANWRHFAMQKTTADVVSSSEENSRSFGDDLQRLTEVVTWEANPSKSLGLEINNASPEVMRAFTAEARALLLDEQGNDQLAAYLGVAMAFSSEGYGAYAGGVNPNNLAHLLPMRQKGQEGFNVVEVRAYARAIQYIFKQDAVPWFRPENKPLSSKAAIEDQMFRVINTKTGRMVPGSRTMDQRQAEATAAKKGEDFKVQGGDLSRAVVVRFNSSLSSTQLDDILSTLQRYLGPDAGYTRTAENEVTVLNFRDDKTKIPFARTDEEFLDAIEQFAQDNREQLGITEHGSIWTEGEYGYEHNWSEDNQGDRLLDEGIIGGRPDLQAWIRGRRDAFNKLLEGYSGQNLADAERAAASDGVLRQSGAGSVQRLRAGDLRVTTAYGTARPGSTAVVGVHYSQQARTSLDAASYGSGLQGAEQGRLAGADQNLSSRIHFYVDTGNGIQPEAGVGGYVHAVQLNNLYDVKTDPLGLVALASVSGRDPGNAWFNNVELAAIKAGFDGLYIPDTGNQGVAVLIGPQHSNVAVDQNGTHSAPEPSAYRPVTARRSYALLSSEIQKFEAQRAEIEGAAPSAKIQNGNLVFDSVDTEAVAQFFPGAAQAREFYQSGEGTRGGFDPRRLTTILNEKTDLSTFLHETAHFFLTVYADMAAQPNATPQMKADMQTILEWFGVKDLATWNAMSLEEQRKYHEQFAYNYELYLFEGKAPSVQLQSIFDRFSAWLRRIYQSIREDLNSIYRQEHGEDLPILTGEVRQVMDRMLASEEQIKQAETVRSMAPMFLTQQEAGMDDATWAAYQAMLQEARDAAVTDLTKASMRQVKWLSNARSRVLKELQKQTESTRKEVRAEVAAQVEAQAVYRAIRFLKRGELLNADGTVTKQDGSYKLSVEALETMYMGEGDKYALLDWSGLGTGQYGMIAKDGLHPDVVAEIIGFDSGDQMVRAILAAPPMKDAIDQKTDARMMAEHSEMTDPKSIELAVEQALHNEARARFVAVELRYLAKSQTPVRVMLQAAKQAARELISRKAIKDIKPREYSVAEGRAAKLALDAMKKGNSNEAAKAKQNQLLQNQLAAEAVAARNEVEKALDSFKKLFRSDEKVAANRNMDLVDAARSILAYYGLGKKGKSPLEYVEKLRAYNPDLYAEIEPLIIKAAQGATMYNELTIDEFRAMRDTVEALWFQSKRENEVMIEGRAIALKQVTEELNARLEEIGIPAEVPGERQAPGQKDRWVRSFYNAKAITRRVEHWADATDGAKGVGPFTKYIWRPIRAALDDYRQTRNQYVKRYVELIQKLELPVAKIEAPELRYTFGNENGGIGKAELLGALLHTGNESNLKKLLLGRGWGTLREDGSLDASNWQAFVSRMITEGKLTKADFDFAQAVWDLNEELKPMAQKAHHDLFGYYFKEVEATPVVTPYGVYRGGYVPAKTDTFLVRDAQKNAKMEELESDFRNSMPSTGMGFTKARVEYNKPLSLDIRLMAKHIDDVIRFAKVQPSIKDALRILRSRGFADNLTRVDPTAIEDMLIPWLNRAARQITGDAGMHKGVDQFWRAVRSRTGISIMFANITNALQQLTGYFPAALKVKPGYLKSALVSYISNTQKVTEDVAGLSPFMADRLKNQVFDMQDTMNELLLNPTKFEKIQKWSSHHGYFLQQAFQNQVDVVTWTATFNQTLAELGADKTDQQAVREATQKADAAVRLTQSSLLPEDVAAFEVGSPFYKTLVQFSGYFNMLANLNANEYVKVFRDLGWKGNKGKLFMIYLLGFGLPMLLSDAIVRTLGGQWDDEDDDGYLDEVMEWFFGSQIRGAVAMVPAFGPGIAAVGNAFNNKPYDDRMTTSPSVSALEGATVGVVKAGINIVSEDKEVTGKNIRDILTMLSLATGIPLTVLGRPIGYAWDVERGKIQPTSGADYARGLATGKASEASKP